MTPRTQAGPAQQRDYAEGLPDYHDPLGGFGGAAPMYSALTMRLWISGFAILFCAIAGGFFLAADMPVWIPVVLFAFVLGFVVNFGWVAHRKFRGEPG